MKSSLKLILISTLLIGILGFTAACASPGAAAVQTSPGANASPAVSSVFTIDSLAVNPAVVNAGIEALITAKVTNTGKEDDNYIGKVKIIDPNKPSLPAYLFPSEVIIPSGSTRLLSVATTINYPGIYKVTWDGVSRDLTVNPEETKPSAAPQNTAPAAAPDFTAVDVVTGKTVTLSQFKGTAILLNFVNYGCSPSVNDKVSAQLMTIKQLKAQRADFVPVSVFCGCCPPEVLRQFAKQNNLDWPWILDTDYSIANKYADYLKKYGYPTLIFIDKDFNMSEIAGSTNLATLTEKLNKISAATLK